LLQKDNIFDRLGMGFEQGLTEIEDLPEKGSGTVVLPQRNITMKKSYDEPEIRKWGEDEPINYFDFSTFIGFRGFKRSAGFSGFVYVMIGILRRFFKKNCIPQLKQKIFHKIKKRVAASTLLLNKRFVDLQLDDKNEVGAVSNELLAKMQQNASVPYIMYHSAVQPQKGPLAPPAGPLLHPHHLASLFSGLNPITSPSQSASHTPRMYYTPSSPSALTPSKTSPQGGKDSQKKFTPSPEQVPHPTPPLVSDPGPRPGQQTPVLQSQQMYKLTTAMASNLFGNNMDETDFGMLDQNINQNQLRYSQSEASLSSIQNTQALQGGPPYPDTPQGFGSDSYNAEKEKDIHPSPLLLPASVSTTSPCLSGSLPYSMSMPTLLPSGFTLSTFNSSALSSVTLQLTQTEEYSKIQSMVAERLFLIINGMSEEMIDDKKINKMKLDSIKKLKKVIKTGLKTKVDSWKKLIGLYKKREKKRENIESEEFYKFESVNIRKMYWLWHYKIALDRFRIPIPAMMLAMLSLLISKNIKLPVQFVTGLLLYTFFAYVFVCNIY
jgi:hypothetical protein